MYDLDTEKCAYDLCEVRNKFAGLGCTDSKQNVRDIRHDLEITLCTYPGAVKNIGEGDFARTSALSARDGDT